MGSQISGTGREGAKQALDAIRRLVRALRLGNQRVERATGLSAAQMFVLGSLDGEAALSLSEVASRTATDQSSVSVVVGRLVTRGLVRRRRCPVDGRRLELSLSPRGEELLRRGPARLVQHGLVDAIETLPAVERRSLARLLGRLVAGMADADGAPEMFFEPARSQAARRKRAGRLEA